MINAVIDVSHFNTVSSFAKVKSAGVFGVVHKATEGTNYVDPKFISQRTEAKNAGLGVGAYHFGTSADPVIQANHLVSVAGKDSLLVLDFEGNMQGNAMKFKQAEQFVNQIKTLTGRYPGLYSGDTIKQALQQAGISKPEQTVLSKCWFWIAQYGPTPSIPKIWPKWTLWQFTDGVHGPEPHTVDGITGGCDRDQYNGTLPELEAFWAQNSG